MQDKPLDQAEQDLLELIRQLHAESGPIPRDALSVAGRGRGLEVARPLNRLKVLGLVRVVEQRPSFLRRLFGARASILIHPLPPAMAAAPATAPDMTAAQAAATPVAQPEPSFDPAAGSLPVETPAPLPPVAADIFAAPVPLQADPPPPEPQAPIADQPAPATPAAPATPRPGPPRVKVPEGYSDDIGGMPVAIAPVALAPGLDPAVLEGLREMLAVLGMEMTMAGEALISDRITRGTSPGEALMQVVVFTFAHAAHYDMMSNAPADSSDLHDYATAIIGELSRLRDAGEIGAAAFAADMVAIMALADSRSDRSARVAELFADPVGGAAPPALLPEELRGIDEDAE